LSMFSSAMVLSAPPPFRQPAVYMPDLGFGNASTFVKPQHLEANGNLPS
jgi:hypothetical protein